MKRIDKETGIILVTVLGVLFMISIVIFNITDKTDLKYAEIENQRSETIAYLLARSGLNIASKYLKNKGNKLTAKSPEFNPPPFVIPDYPNTYVSMTIEDEQAKLNLNSMFYDNCKQFDSGIYEMFERLFRYTDIPMHVLEKIHDWMDSDDEIFRSGGERADYENFKNILPSNYYFLIPSELALIKDISDEDIRKLYKYCTIYFAGQTRQKINVNTASKEVLWALSDEMSENIVDEIIIYRTDKPFKNISELQKLEIIKTDPKKIYDIIKGFVTVESNLYSVTIELMINDFRYKYWAFIERKKRTGKLVPIYFQRLNVYNG